MSFSPLVDQLIQALRCLPGVGPKSAQRMALHLLENDRSGAKRVAESLEIAVEQVKHCERCRILSETPTCRICSDTRRDPSMLCVVESPADVIAIEQTALFKGYYFVLKGHLSPIDGIGPQEIGIDLLFARLKNSEVTEVIMAINSTVEGEATSYYIAQQLDGTQITLSRLAQGVPLGGELEYVDGGTLAHAFQGRQPVCG